MDFVYLFHVPFFSNWQANFNWLKNHIDPHDLNFLVDSLIKIIIKDNIAVKEKGSHAQNSGHNLK
jgi:hypothetical protein